MPVSGRSLWLLSEFDQATAYGRFWLDVASVGVSGATFLRGTQATKANFIEGINATDSALFIGLGHGNPTTFSAQDKEVVFQSGEDLSLLSGRVIYLLSCSVGVSLGPELVYSGVLSFIGYTVDFTWICDPPYDPRYDNKSASFFKSVVSIARDLASGKTALEAHERGIAIWNEQIDLWSASADPEASEVVHWMVSNRDGQTLLGEGSVAPYSGVALEVGVPVIPLLTGVGMLLIAIV